MPFQLFNTSVNFLAALGGTPFSTQNFESFSDGDNLNGVEFIPGVFVTSNLPRVEAFRGSGDTELFILDRQSVAEDAFYDINFRQPFNAVGFDIDAFNPATPGPAVLDIFFSDGDSTSLNIFPTNPTESDPIFFGIVADKNISKIRLTEGPEIGGFGNEEIALDNFIVPRSTIANIPSQNDDNLIGTANNDTIDLGNGQDIANGLAGDDVINGGDGDDRIFGGEGNDTLLGGQGQDRLFGDSGDDLLNGGAGDNTLTGGLGRDIFVLSTEGKNTIVDFEDGQDLLKLVGGLTFESLSIFNQNGDTWITTNNNQPLAFLTGVNSNLITAADFM